MLLEHCAERPRSLGELVAVVRVGTPQARFSELVAVVEQASWELLHEGALTMRSGTGAAAPITTELWRELLLAPGSWSPDAQLRLELAADRPG